MYYILTKAKGKSGRHVYVNQLKAKQKKSEQQLEYTAGGIVVEV